MKYVKLFEQFVSEGRSPEEIRDEYKELKKKSISSLRNIWSLSYKIGNPKELDKEGLISDILNSKHGSRYVKAAFEQYIREEAMKPNEESDVVADDITLEDGTTISSAEIIGAILNSESEDELENFFFDKYGETAFKQGELAEIKQLWNEYQAEEKEKEAEEEDSNNSEPGEEGSDGGEEKDQSTEDILADL